ncbi:MULTISPECIES: symmetrical bis(5'-nucleosyl)-tetraphosphatase [Azospira]|uniref:Bis(5'-nucleosyl)-tetraphosphatase, symmetrical n=1 Tax=Azospira oryzae (strain ATCC BAA-33 / DSM 13638 / PS) TaxID=640081 RepID=G8QP14_AZOOP|nr:MULTISPECIES: symmetrical bis(5'-nucleosyl)-tetraphosphatase [Azospira]AEV24813.1 symmetrical bis(5'-nucleosyl)-tetraphosphatase [Azospira oryzae PS]MDK9691920.1 symmetrical bis(5'-nucleosyl)-tetraphosphatase [Azospira sp.]
MATYAVGDIQGCFASLQALLDKCSFSPEFDRLWLVGDLVNRGPRSLETLRFVKGLGDRAVTVLGNHDLSLLMAAEGFGKRHRSDTIDDILAATDRDELLHWLRHQRLMHVQGDYAMVHAGLLPAWSVAEAQALAGEVEQALQAENYREFLANMWGSEPGSWDSSLTGWPRLRVIVNAMTRMRFCSPAGEMDFKAKGELSQAPAGYLPWFEVPGRRSAATVLVTGHWSALGLRLEPNLLALDSGCLWGGKLSALRLEDRALFQVDCAADEAVPLFKE